MHKKVTPGIDLKNPRIDIWGPKMRFPKMYIFGAPIESTGPWPSQFNWYLPNSLKARAMLGLDNTKPLNCWNYSIFNQFCCCNFQVCYKNNSLVECWFERHFLPHSLLKNCSKTDICKALPMIDLSFECQLWKNLDFSTKQSTIYHVCYHNC